MTVDSAFEKYFHDRADLADNLAENGSGLEARAIAAASLSSQCCPTSYTWRRNMNTARDSIVFIAVHSVTLLVSYACPNAPSISSTNFSIS